MFIQSSAPSQASLCSQQIVMSRADVTRDLSRLYPLVFKSEGLGDKADLD
jgi:hypothetical protein